MYGYLPVICWERKVFCHCTLSFWLSPLYSCIPSGYKKIQKVRSGFFFVDQSFRKSLIASKVKIIFFQSTWQTRPRLVWFFSSKVIVLNFTKNNIMYLTAIKFFSLCTELKIEKWSRVNDFQVNQTKTGTYYQHQDKWFHRKIAYDSDLPITY